MKLTPAEIIALNAKGITVSWDGGGALRSLDYVRSVAFDELFG